MNLLTMNRSCCWKSLTVAHWGKLLALSLVLCWLELGFPWNAKAATFTTFDAPGSVRMAPFSMNPAGAITGYYVDASGAFHGFLRASDGSLTTFDAPDATGSLPYSMNPAGAITGVYYDASGALHGFLRSR